MKVLLASIAMLLPAFTLAETSAAPAAPEELVEYCKTKPCRTDVSITLKTADGSLYKRSFPLDLPVVDNGFLNIYPGEVLFVEVDVGRDGAITLRHVAQIENPDITFVFRFEQQAEIGDGTGMVLTVSNPLSRAVKYRLGIMPLDGDSLLATSSCALLPKTLGSEFWPYPIFQAVAGDFHFVDVEKNGMACTE